MLKQPKTSTYFVNGERAGSLGFGFDSIVKQTVFCALTNSGKANKSDNVNDILLIETKVEKKSG